MENQLIRTAIDLIEKIENCNHICADYALEGERILSDLRIHKVEAYRLEELLIWEIKRIYWKDRKAQALQTV